MGGATKLGKYRPEKIQRIVHFNKKIEWGVEKKNGGWGDGIPSVFSKINFSKVYFCKVYPTIHIQGVSNAHLLFVSENIWFVWFDHHLEVGPRTRGEERAVGLWD